MLHLGRPLHKTQAQSFACLFKNYLLPQQSRNKHLLFHLSMGCLRTWCSDLLNDPVEFPLVFPSLAKEEIHRGWEVRFVRLNKVTRFASCIRITTSGHISIWLKKMIHTRNIALNSRKITMMVFTSNMLWIFRTTSVKNGRCFASISLHDKKSPETSTLTEYNKRRPIVQDVLVWLWRSPPSCPSEIIDSSSLLGQIEDLVVHDANVANVRATERPIFGN